MCAVVGVTADTHKNCFFSPNSEGRACTKSPTISPRTLGFWICCKTCRLVNILLRRSKRRWWRKKTYINDESALHRELYGRRPRSSEAAGRLASWLCPETPYLFQCTVDFEDRARNYSVLSRNHFIKQVSQTVGQRWLIAVAMEVQQLMLPPGDLHFLSHQALLCPDFLSAWEGKIRYHRALYHFWLSQVCSTTQGTHLGIYSSVRQLRVYFSFHSSKVSIFPPLFYFI